MAVLPKVGRLPSIGILLQLIGILVHKHILLGMIEEAMCLSLGHIEFSKQAAVNFALFIE